MAVEQPPGVINDVETDAKIQRRIAQSLLGGAIGAFAGGVGASNGGAHGVVAPTHLAVTQSGTPGMSVEIAAGLAFITGTVSAEQGPYNFYNNATVTLSISAADPTQPRRDLVVAQVRDSTYSGADDDARLFVVVGTPAASPVDPTLPDNCLVLARVAVAALASSITNANITDLRTFGGGGGPKSAVVKFTSSGTYTKPSRLSHIVVEVQAAGGASGGAPASTAANTSFGQSGGGGGYCRKQLTADQLRATEPVTVGAGGTGVSGASGNVGGSSQFGDGGSLFTLINATGGGGGATMTAGATGTPRVLLAVAGGSGSGGDVIVRGGKGGPTYHVTGGSIGGDEGGGFSFLGGAGGNYTLEANGIAATTPGGGGGGMRNSGAQVVRTGGAGFRGEVIITEFYL